MGRVAHILLLLLLLPCTLQAQQGRWREMPLDSLHIGKNKRVNTWLGRLVESVKAAPEDTSLAPQNRQSETPYEQYRGKIIRQVIINNLRFEQKVTDTTRRFAVFGTKILNDLHTTTRPWVLRNHIFVKPGDTLNPFKVADNERFLRTLDFIQDARIVVKPLPHTDDTVDIEVYSRDLFSITGGAEARGLDYMKGTLAEGNLLGMAQRVQFTALIDKARSPNFGYEALYRKNNIGGSFINATAIYSVIARNAESNREEVRSYALQLDRPLVSPYSQFAGGLYLARNRSENLYHTVDTAFYPYLNTIMDGWVAYNISSRKLRTNSFVRDRRVAAFRYFQSVYDEVPPQIGNRYDPLFNNRLGALGRVTFFRQDFYKTNYIYGFGTTEDVPYGYNISVTGGWYKQLQLERPYAGFDVNHYRVTKGGAFIRYFARGGSLWQKGSWQDASLVVGLNAWSRLYDLEAVKLRQFVGISYSRIWNRVTTPLLTISNPLGLRYFIAGEPEGDQRISLHAECAVFLNYSLLGFKFAPFVFTDGSYLTPENTPFLKSDFYTGLGGGLRARNENLVFRTIELRAVYFPRSVPGYQGFKVLLTSNIRFRYSSNYISAPAMVDLNMDTD